MHTEMWEHPAVADNIAMLRRARRAHRRARRRAASPAATSARAAWPIRSGSSPRSNGCSGRGDLAGRARRRDRRWHPRADRRRAGDRQPQQRQAGLRHRRRGRWPRGAEVTLVSTVDLPTPAGAVVAPGRDRRRDAGRGASRLAADRRRGRHGRRGRRLPPGKVARRQDQEGRRRPADRPRADARHPRRARCRASAPVRCSSASPPRPTISSPTPTAKLRRKRLDLIVANDVSAARRRLRTRHQRGYAAAARRGACRRSTSPTSDDVARAVDATPIVAHTYYDPTRPATSDRSTTVSHVHLHLGERHRGPSRQDGRPGQ